MNKKNVAQKMSKIDELKSLIHESENLRKHPFMFGRKKHKDDFFSNGIGRMQSRHRGNFGPGQEDIDK